MKVVFFRLFIICLLPLLLTCKTDSVVPEAKAGVIDLTSHNFKNDGPIKLDGEWDFFWKPENFESTNFDELENLDVTIHNVPDIWPNENIGYSIYKLRILTNGSTKNYAIYTLGLSTAAEFYINEEMIGRSGRVGRTKDTTYPMGYGDEYYFITEDSEIELIIKLSNFHHRQGGLLRSIILGSEKDIQSIYHKLLLFYITLITILSVLGVYLILNYFLLGRIPSNLYLGLFCLLLAIRFYIDETGIINIFIDNFHRVYYTKTSYITLNLIVVSFVLYISDRFPFETFKKIDMSFILISLLYINIIFFTPLSLCTALMPYYHIVILFGVFYVSHVVIKAIRNRREGVYIFLYGYIFLALVIINDILISRNLLNSVNLLTVGILVFIISEVIYMSRKSRLNFLRERTEKISSDSKKDIITNISHEFRTPMNSIIGYLEMVLQNKQLDYITQEYLTTSYKSAKSLLKLINDFLDLRKIETNSIEVVNNSFNLEFEINYIFSVLEPLIEDRDITLSYRISDSVPNCIVTDLLKFRQILINLMNNAIKFTDQGSIRLEITTSHKKLVLKVIDTGIGIAEEEMGLIFYSFKQLDHSTTRKYTGSGLGLSIAKEFTRLLEGEISVSSILGKGSEFTVSLPLLAADCKEKCDERCKKVDYITKNSTSRYISILVADDVMENAKLILIRLQMMGHKVHVVFNGKEAVESCNNNRYDLILMDLYMPIMDGYEAAKKIKERCTDSDIKIVAISANDVEYDADELKTKGFDGVLSKPVDFLELETLIKNIVPKYSGVLIPYTYNRKENIEKDLPLTLAGIDLEAGINLWQDEQAYYSALISFKNKFKNIIDELKSLYNNKSYEILYSELHKIKGVSGNLYLVDINRLSGELCILIKKEDLSEIDPKFQILIKNFNTAIKSISSLEKMKGIGVVGNKEEVIKLIDRCIILNKRECLDLQAVTELEEKLGEKQEDLTTLIESNEYAEIELKLLQIRNRLYK